LKDAQYFPMRFILLILCQRKKTHTRYNRALNDIAQCARSTKHDLNHYGGARAMYGGEERCIQGVDGETWFKETIWKT